MLTWNQPLAVVIEPHQRAHLFKVTEVCSSYPERDKALLGVLLGTPLKLTEIAQLTIRDLLRENGEYLTESEIRAEIAFNGFSRPLYWSSPKLKNLLDDYLDARAKRGHQRLAIGTAYRGNDPDSRLFLNNRGQDFALQGRKDKQGNTRYTCSSLSRLYKQLLSQAGIDGATAGSGRRTFASMLRRRGYDVPHIHALLGNQDLKTTRRMLDSDPVDMGQIAAKAF